MVIVMEHTAKEEEIQKVVERLTEWGYDIHRSTGATRTVLGAVGTPRTVADPADLGVLPGVREVVRISEPYSSWGEPSSPRTPSFGSARFP